jgi:hypothetical protein
LEVPADETVDVLSNVTLKCQAQTDPAMMSHLHIEWLVNGQPVTNTRVTSVDTHRSALYITNARVTDSAEYTCRATNGIDFTESYARVVVRGNHHTFSVVDWPGGLASLTPWTPSVAYLYRRLTIDSYQTLRHCVTAL